MTEYLVRSLKSGNKIGVLSRGYGRRSSDYKEVLPENSALETGDEPLQLKKNHPEITVCVDGNRVRGIIQMLHDHDDTDLVILDDAYQHRAVAPGLSILLTDYSDPFFTDYLLPTGNLRELRKNVNRADIIIVTKVPEQLSETLKNDFRQQIKRFSNAQVFFSSISYTRLVPLFETAGLNRMEDKKILLFTGIANPKPLESFLKAKCKGLRTIKFPDHHRFSQKDLERIRSEFKSLGNSESILCTTEKDAMRIVSLPQEVRSILSELPVYYQKIETSIHEQDQFNHLIHEYLQANKGNHRIPAEQNQPQA